MGHRRRPRGGPRRRWLRPELDSPDPRRVGRPRRARPELRRLRTRTTSHHLGKRGGGWSFWGIEESQLEPRKAQSSRGYFKSLPRTYLGRPRNRTHWNHPVHGREFDEKRAIRRAPRRFRDMFRVLWGVSPSSRGKGAGGIGNEPSTRHERCGNAALTPSSGAGTPPDTCFFWCGNASRSDISLSGAGTPDRPRTRISGSRRIGKRAHCAWRARFRNWELPEPDPEGQRSAMLFNLQVRTWRLREKKVGRDLKRARPASFLPHPNRRPIT